MLRRIHAFYALMSFVTLFLIFFPLLLIPILSPARFRMVGKVNRWWAYASFYSWFLPIRIELKSALNPKAQYIFCPNHFSYLDIPAMALNPHDTIFVGKHDMENIPLFGFMYRKLHITVDRSRLKSKYSTYLQSLEALDQGKSLTIFPEGGIVSKSIPAMERFKDGPFRLAVEKGIPIVPVTMPDNWLILKEDPFRIYSGTVKLIFHEPVIPMENSPAELDRIKKKVFEVIQAELSQCKPT
ncbi:MAG: 1-acyl-sn-glycerol-3-phosphate acyltransferase [Bacteroidetes bacterium]|nr:1-acyl-sn-glycerol-3-phosphate acyltransferase [Bacteroidota bacterium]